MEHIQIREDYKGYSPAFDVVGVIRRLLSAAPSNYLAGLHSIVLRNLGRSHPKKRRIRYRGKKLHLSHFEGFYYHASKKTPAWIELYPDNILPASMPRWIQKIRIIQDLFFADALFHEIGHHIDSSVAKERDSEAAAEKWRKKLLRLYVRKHYSYLRPFKIPIRYGLRMILWFTKRKD